MERKADLDLIWSGIRSRLDPLLDQLIADFNAEVARLGLEGIVVR
jgi:hypothetical protein